MLSFGPGCLCNNYFSICFTFTIAGNCNISDPTILALETDQDGWSYALKYMETKTTYLDAKATCQLAAPGPTQEETEKFFEIINQVKDPLSGKEEKMMIGVTHPLYSLIYSFNLHAIGLIVLPFFWLGH